MTDLVSCAKYAEQLTGIPAKLCCAQFVSENGWSVPSDFNFGNVSYTGEGVPSGGIWTGVTSVNANKTVNFDTAEHGIESWAELLNAPKSEKALTVETADILEAIKEGGIEAACKVIGESNWAESHYDDGRGAGSLILDVYNSPKMDELFASEAQPAPAPVAPSVAVLQEGSTGDEVKKLQERLNELGDHLVVDGDFGPATDEAVKAFQSANSLRVDGIVGSQTQAALEKKVGLLVYTLQEGDSLSKVSVDYQVPVEVLQRFNHFDPSKPLNPGTEVHIPNRVTVKSGDTLGAIAQTVGYGSNYQEIARINMINPDRIQVGEILFY